MKREDIIRMARETGARAQQKKNCDAEYLFSAEQIERLLAAEREAMVAEAAKLAWAMKNEDPFEDAVQEVAAIRARGNT